MAGISLLVAPASQFSYFIISSILYRPLSHGGHFGSGDLKSFVYARLASFSKSILHKGVWIFYPNLRLSPLPTQTTAIYLSLLAISLSVLLLNTCRSGGISVAKETQNTTWVPCSILSCFGVNSLEVMTKQSVRFLILSGGSIFQGFILIFSLKFSPAAVPLKRI